MTQHGANAAGKHLVSITTSGNSIQWLDGQGAWQSLKPVFDNYLANAFASASTDHLHASNIVEGMSEQAVREELFRVTQFADAICARLMSEAHALRAAAA